MENRYPLTKEQLNQAREDLAEMQSRSEEIWRLIAAAYGETDQRAIRADEVHGAVQRLRWELERLERSAKAAGV
jgi:hypothetical protein